MSQLRLPLRGRDDVCIYQFPDKIDADAAAVEMIEKLKQQARSGGQPVPELRVVPLANREAYSEALSLTVEAFAGQRVPAWIVDEGQALLGFRRKDFRGSEVEERRSLRIVQMMLN